MGNEVDIVVGQALKTRRSFLGRSLEVQASELDLTEDKLAAIEAGEVRASAEVLFRCCQSLYMKPADFYQGVFRLFDDKTSGKADDSPSISPD